MRQFLWKNLTSLRPKNWKSLYGNREFHVLFWSMIYAALKSSLSVSEIGPLVGKRSFDIDLNTRTTTIILRFIAEKDKSVLTIPVN